MSVLITGGAGFIGANFVLDWVAHSDEKIVNLDKLTYAGNLESLVSLKNNPQHVFVQGDIGDVALVLCSTLPLKAMWTALFTARVNSLKPTLWAPFACWNRCVVIGMA
jgi:dTDP-D-glucose 4,6-dehydratase